MERVWAAQVKDFRVTKLIMKKKNNQRGVAPAKIYSSKVN